MSSEMAHFALMKCNKIKHASGYHGALLQNKTHATSDVATITNTCNTTSTAPPLHLPPGTTQTLHTGGIPEQPSTCSAQKSRVQQPPRTSGIQQLLSARAAYGGAGLAIISASAAPNLPAVGLALHDDLDKQSMLLASVDVCNFFRIK
jgi:hypothetical protein